jgi:hypothetical protein
MKTMKWDTIKREAVLIAVGNESYIYENLAPYAILAGIADMSLGFSRPDKNSSPRLGFGWRKNAVELRNKAIHIIEHWDIRRVKSLIDLFPGCVPKYCLGKVPECYVADNDKAEWMVCFK